VILLKPDTLEVNVYIILIVICGIKGYSRFDLTYEIDIRH